MTVCVVEDLKIINIYDGNTTVHAEVFEICFVIVTVVSAGYIVMSELVFHMSYCFVIVIGNAAEIND